MTDLINPKYSAVIGPRCEWWRRRTDGPVEWAINRLCSVSKCKCLQRCLYVWHRSAACPDASRAWFWSRGSVPEAWRVSSSPTLQFFPNAASLEAFPPLLPRLSGYSVAEGTRLLQGAQMDAFRSRCSKGSCYDNIIPGGRFFFLRVAVGSQRQGNCLSSEKGGGEYEFPMAEIKWKKKKEVTAAISKNIYFSLQNPQERSGKAGRGGEGRVAGRDRKSSLVYWELLDWNVLPQDALDTETWFNDDRTSAVSWMRARRVASSQQFCNRTGLSGL